MACAPTFGLGYRDILTLSPPAQLTAEQERILKLFEHMAEAKDLSRLPECLNSLRSPEYRHLVHIVHKERSLPDNTLKITARKRFQTPFTDYFQQLRGQPALQSWLLTTLAHQVRTTPSEHVLKNAVEALVDIYFYVLRPNGQAFQESAGSKSLTWFLEPGRNQLERQARQLRHELLTHFSDLLTQNTVPLKTRRILRNELIFGLRDIEHVIRSHPKRFTRQHIQPLTQLPLPVYPRIPAPNDLTQKLKTTLNLGDLETLKRMIATGEMMTLIPEWERVAGPDNHQHIVQDYTLADHLLKTVEATRKSRYFKALTPEEQFRVTTAAFFHDLHKRTGPANLRAVARISVDPHHPGRSAEAALELLPNLGYTPAQIDDIVTLIDHHQLLGNMAKPDGDPTSPRSIRLAADKLGSASRLRMLRALTEGDIRCVRMDVPGRTWYDADLAERLQRFSQKILDELNRRGLTHRPVQPAEFSQ